MDELPVLSLAFSTISATSTLGPNTFSVIPVANIFWLK